MSSKPTKTRRPRLASNDIPQADDLPRIRRVVAALAAGPGSDTATLAAATAVAARHVSYALAAARILGWTTAEGTVTGSGQQLLGTAAGSPEERRLMIEAVIGCPVLETLGIDLLGPVEPKPDELSALLQQAAELSESTALRRATSLLAWRRQLLDAPPTSEPASVPASGPEASAEREAEAEAELEDAPPRVVATGTSTVVYRGGAILTMTSDAGPGSVAEALAVRDGRILAVGSEAEVRQRAGQQARVIDLAGRAVLPGFIDPHHHLGLAALYAGAVDVSPRATGSLPALIDRLRRAAATLAAGEWVIATGLDQLRHIDRRPPTRVDLDAACPDHPLIVIHHTFHEAFVNSRALEAAGIRRGQADPPGGQVVRGRGGEPTGHLLETALGPVEALARRALLARDAAGLAARLEATQTRLFSFGLTRVSDPTVPPEMERTFRELSRLGVLRIGLDMLPLGDSYLSPPWDRLELSDGSVSLQGSETLRAGPMKLFFDGGQSCAVCGTLGQLLRMLSATLVSAARHRSLDPFRAAANVPVRLDSRLRFHAGRLYHPDDSTALLLAGAAVDRGFALAVHAIGNEAVAQAARVLRRVRDRHPDGLAPRIEHGLVIDDSLLEELPRSGVMVVTQPGFLGMIDRRLAPPMPGLRMCPLRSLLQAGVPVAASSDAPVTSPDPLLGVKSACQRLDGDGQLVDSGETLDPVQALALYTREAARAAGCLPFAGTLEAGKRADLVMLSSDPRRIAGGAARLEDLRVTETVLAGQTVFPVSASAATGLE